MDNTTRDKLFEAWAWCDEEDRSTFFMFNYMADHAGVTYEEAVDFVMETTNIERNEWYKKRNFKNN